VRWISINSYTLPLPLPFTFDVLLVTSVIYSEKLFFFSLFSFSFFKLKLAAE